MYNSYLNQFPIDVTPKPLPPKPEDCPESPPEKHSGSGLLSLLSGTFGQKNSLNDLFSGENLIVLAALAFLVYAGDGIDTELLILAVLFLLIGL